MIFTAKIMMGSDFENVEYLRGICELIADLFPLSNVDTGDRAVEIAQMIGATKEEAETMYFLRP